ncbi:MAG: hypothetical protein AVDCRST_MAG64-4267 [uncultured Phycisphaerae bacterium]|uniref:Uncharacterized protein n=1 Tax=uncultured Phycisphaerae bacterium TaxID=904963 RepID=A0A6J4QN35_9BACT|nr:MAG: hypothetical protein AVDCRST_MAG64-4267 [uncultured Phycisphaerae bacterium]
MTVRRLACLLLLLFAAGQSARAAEARNAFDALLDTFPVVDEIDAATVAPAHESAPGVSRVTDILGRPARHLPVTDHPATVGWVIGKGKQLEPGAAYVLEVEYPDDVPRATFVANRGADHVRGFATGTTFGDARQQFVQPSVESLDYPQTGRWQVYRSIFFLHDRFQGVYAQRDAKPGGRPHGPADGFHVLVFQTRRLNDPRNEGAAVGKIRLRRVPDVSKLYADVEPLPDGLPKRRVFYREEMADEPISSNEQTARGVNNVLDWFVYKAKLNRVLGINTFAKDLLEFGHNQGWDGGDPTWINNAQPPMTRAWDDLVPRLAAEGVDLLPYYEYKGAINWKDGGFPPSLAWERRAQKLYHGKPNTQYTGVTWTEDHNVDLTDPDALADAKRVLDRTLGAHKGKAPFAGVWFRTRDNHLPMSFAEATIARFKAALSDEADADAGSASPDALRASYEGDRKLYDRYVDWWLGERAKFLDALRDHAAQVLADDDARLWFTPWTTEQIPMMRDGSPGAMNGPAQVTTDDPAWWDAFAKTVSGESWFRWALVPTPFDRAVAGDYYRKSIEHREPVSPEPWRSEPYHSAPIADPARYRDAAGVMLTFPAGRLFTVARPELLEEYRTRAGLTVLRHYTLNEDNHDAAKGPSDLPFDGQVGYVSVDVDRAGPHVRLMEARAVAAADPTNLGMLAGSAFSTGFPDYVRRFNAAFLALPALPSEVVPGAADHPEVVVRQIRTPKDGTYVLVVNTSMRPAATRVKVPGRGRTRDLVAREDLGEPGELKLNLHSGELRTYRVQTR